MGCERKTAGLVKSWQVSNVLPNAVFTLAQISIEDPRLDSDEGPAPRIVYVLEMTADEWNKLYQNSYKRA